MKINKITVIANKFAFDGCHKIYLIESPVDEADAKAHGYEIFPISQLQDAYDGSCGLRFISNWQLTTNFVHQFEDAEFA
jgi:hypothetical protein